MRKIMTPELFERYKNVKSSKGFTFSNAIQVEIAPCDSSNQLIYPRTN